MNHLGSNAGVPRLPTLTTPNAATLEKKLCVRVKVPFTVSTG